jgi:sugar/nucleoside kinase (ribokinase family)
VTRLVVVGDVMTDVIVRVEDPVAVASDTPARIRLGQGGSAANTAAWLGYLDLWVRFVGCVGDDALGEVALGALLDTGVRNGVAVVAGVASGVCVVLVAADGERTMLPDAGANAHLAEDAVDPADLGPGAHLHLSGYALTTEGSRAGAVAALGRARESGSTTSVDPASAAPLARLGGARFLELTEGVGLVIATRDEAEVLVGTRDPAAALASLGGHYPEVVLKLGADGAVWSDGRDEVHVPAAPPAGIVLDSTGAGDAFAAGLLAGRARGAGPKECLDAACALASLAVTREGARPPGHSTTRP